MGIFAGIWKREHPSNVTKAILSAFGIGAETWSGEQVSINGSLQLGAVYACNKVISETIASLPLHLYRKRADGGREEATNHPLFGLMSREPNPEMSPLEFMESQQSYLNLWGNCLAQTIRDGRGQVVEIWPLRFDRVSVERKSGKLVFKYARPNGQEAILLANEVLFIRDMTLDGIVGMSRIAQHRQGIGAAVATEKYSAKLWANGAKPGAALEHPGVLEDEVRENLRQSIKEQAGGDNSHNFLILEEGMTWKQIGLPPEDAQFIQTKTQQISDICRIMRCPGVTIEHGEKTATYASSEQFFQWFRETIRPWTVRWEQALNRQLLLPRDRAEYYFKFNLKAMLAVDATARAQYYTARFNMGSLSPNDIRRLEDENPVEGGDQRFIQLNMVPLDMAADVAAPDQNAQRSEQRSLEARKAIAIRNARGRNKLANTFKPAFRESAAKVTRREVKAIRKEAEKQLRAAGDFESWVEQYYKEQAPTIRRDMAGVFMTYARAIWDQAQAEIGGDGEWSAEAERLMSGYLDNFVAEWVSSRTGQLRQLLRESDPELIFDDIGQRLDEWEERTPDKVANRHVIEAAGAIARMIFLAGGFKLMWVNQGSKSCPYCEELDGRIVGREQTFVSGGEDFQPSGAEPMRVNGAKTHPPLHEGCICTIVPV